MSDSDSSIWLFGSVHILDPNVTWRTPAFNEVLSGADEVYFELVLNADGMASLGRLTIERGFLPVGQTLSDILSPDQNKRLDKALAELGLPRTMFEQMQPWMAALTLSTTALAQSGEAGAANFAGGIESQLQAEIEDEPRARARDARGADGLPLRWDAGGTGRGVDADRRSAR